MRRVLKRVKALVRRAYFRLGRPLLNQMRVEQAQECAVYWQAMRAEAARLAKAREDIYAEMLRLSQEVVDYHESLTQKVADELTKINKKLEPPARAA
jgi:uncharacterized coiled-coil DUF342 family protein